MQNNVTELTQKLLRALDSNYNVIDFPEVVDSISQLEKVAITKELLETTRLGKYVNELRRKTSNQELSRRAKELLKKWRSMVLPEANGQIRSSANQTPSKAVGSTKTSPPFSKEVSSPMVSPALQGRRLSPGVPQLPKKLSPHVSPGLPVHKMVSPQTQMVSPKVGLQAQGQKVGEVSPPLTASQNSDLYLNQLRAKKRPVNDALMDKVNVKRSRLNGVADLDLSDSSNSSFKDVILGTKQQSELVAKRDVIVINSDSNSSCPTTDASLDHSVPKKRGRKKGSKNHKNLIDEAETSFTNKLAVSASRGGSKVKTTQEILAGIQNKNSTTSINAVSSSSKPSKEDLEEKAAKLTERVSMIDRKLNANAHRNKNSQKHKLALTPNKPNERVIESGSVINDKSLLDRLKQEENGEEDEDEDEEDEEEVVIVDDVVEPLSRLENQENKETDDVQAPVEVKKSLSVEEALALLPPIDRSVLDEVDPEPPCTCYLKENKKSDFSISEDDDDECTKLPLYETIEDPDCPAKAYLENKYKVTDVSEYKIVRLHETFMPYVNGNWSLGTPRPAPQMTEDGLYVNVVPSIYEMLDKDVRPLDSFKKYSVSEGNAITNKTSVIKDDDKKPDVNSENRPVNSESSDNQRIEQEVFREWYECVDKTSHNGDTLRILPYCIVD
ncbi:hypothetical protein ABEB36_007866 [Hypothenemus hampei]|uniref:Mediator of RNA polymerase II transcription subunit 26 n=1 Tax=Hypothenemus hampei TaxID=57062 RepID=A0ABD1EVD9_HYPHA